MKCLLIPDDVVQMKTYTGDNTGPGPQKVRVTIIRRLKGSDGAKPFWYELPVKPSLALFNHSPDGFQWSYHGSGPAQLALAILLDLTENQKLSVRLHQEFKRHFIATAGKHLMITEPEIWDWLQVKS